MMRILGIIAAITLVLLVAPVMASCIVSAVFWLPLVMVFPWVWAVWASAIVILNAWSVPNDF